MYTFKCFKGPISNICLWKQGSWIQLNTETDVVRIRKWEKKRIKNIRSLPKNTRFDQFWQLNAIFANRFSQQTVQHNSPHLLQHYTSYFISSYKWSVATSAIWLGAIIRRPRAARAARPRALTADSKITQVVHIFNERPHFFIYLQYI